MNIFLNIYDNKISINLGNCFIIKCLCVKSLNFIENKYL